jgi:hypothetical protein
MRLVADFAVMASWGQGFGSYELAAEEVKRALGCSHSKAGKLARGIYPFALSPSEQAALAGLLKIKEDVLFPRPSKGKARAS